MTDRSLRRGAWGVLVLAGLVGYGGPTTAAAQEPTDPTFSGMCCPFCSEPVSNVTVRGQSHRCRC